jgi:dTDP-4-amino-4,6-dideoxy-D-galactose acyltransferase
MRRLSRLLPPFAAGNTGMTTTRSTVPCQVLPWDSNWWGRRTARVEGRLSDAGRVAEVDRWCQAERIELLYYLCPIDESAGFGIVEDAGYRLMDVRVELSCTVSASLTGEQPGSSNVRPATAADIPCLEKIASSAHRNTRFYADRQLRAKRCDALYAHWIVRDFEDPKTSVFVEEAEGEVTGYVTCPTNDTGSGEIGLIAVAEGHRGRRVGEGLVRHSLYWFACSGVSRVDVVTQGGNAQALRLYGRCGFIVGNVSLWFHKCYPSISSTPSDKPRS